MSQEMIAFLAVTGLTVLFALLAAVLVLLKRDGLFLPLLIGASACLLFQYVGLSFFLALIDGAAYALSVPADGPLIYLVQILSVALYEVSLITLLFLALYKLVRYRFAVAFGVGYWCFFTLAGSVGDLVTMLSAKQALFYGTAFEVMASGLQLPLQLPLYLTIAVSAALCVKLKKPGAFFFALLMDVLFRCVLASYSVFFVPMLIALGFLVMLSLLYVYYVVRAKKDFPPVPVDEESEPDGDDAALDAADQEADDAEDTDDTESTPPDASNESIPGDDVKANEDAGAEADEATDSEV